MAHYICENPLTDHPEGIVEFVYRSDQPAYFGCIRELNLLSEQSLAIEEFSPNLGFLYKSADKKLKAFFIIVIKKHDTVSPEKIKEALLETVIWYATCLNNAIPGKEGTKGGYMLLKDYNRHTPGLQILYVPSKERYIVSLEKGVTSFTNSDSLFDFLHSIGYTEEQLAEDGEMTTIKI